MNKAQLIKIQAQRGTKIKSSDVGTKTWEQVVSDCRSYIRDFTAVYRTLESAARTQRIKELIVEYVSKRAPRVSEYLDSENKPDTQKLINALTAEITDYGKLTWAMSNDSVFEIRGNGKEIKVEVNGDIVDLTDDKGRIISWKSPEEQNIAIRKMCGDVRVSPKYAVISARTQEGYRIAVVHSSAVSSDPLYPENNGYSVFVLRKFKKHGMSMSEVVKKGTMSDNMAQLCELFTDGGAPWITCGPTSSGKTTTNNAILKTVPDDIRIVLLQNPSEIDARNREEKTGRVMNDVIHLEAVEKENATPTDPTMANLMDITLRLSPTIVSLGEIRANREFAYGMKILQAGHPVNTTIHADDSEGALQRFLTAYMAETHESIDTALPALARLLKFVVVQHKLRDNKRRVLQISEIIGVDEKNPHKAEIRDIYLFEPVGTPEYDANGKIISIPGIHKRVGKLSDRTIRKLQLSGVHPDRYAPFIRELPNTENGGADEVETYTGVWVTNETIRKKQEAEKVGA